MANHKSAKKRIVRNTKRAGINGNRVTRIRTYLKKVEEAIASGDAHKAEEALKIVRPQLQRGATKGAVDKKTAARKISRLSARIKALKKKAA
jgi:small subunit ribosomal protein S20